MDWIFLAMQTSARGSYRDRAADSWGADDRTGPRDCPAPARAPIVDRSTHTSRVASGTGFGHTDQAVGVRRRYTLTGRPLPIDRHGTPPL